MKASVTAAVAAATLVSADGWAGWQSDKDPKKVSSTTWYEVPKDADKDPKTWSTWEDADPKKYGTSTWADVKDKDPKKAATTWSAWDNNYNDKKTKTITITVDKNDKYHTWFDVKDQGYGYTKYVDADGSHLTWDEWTKKPDPAKATWSAWDNAYYNNKDKTKTVYVNRKDKHQTWFDLKDEGYAKTVYYADDDKSQLTWDEWTKKPEAKTTWADDYYKTVTVTVKKGDKEDWKTVGYNKDSKTKTVYYDEDKKTTYTWDDWSAKPTGKNEWADVKDDKKDYKNEWADVKDDKKDDKKYGKPYTYYVKPTNKVETYCDKPTTIVYGTKTTTVTEAKYVTLEDEKDIFTYSVPLYTYAKDCGADDKDAYTWTPWVPDSDKKTGTWSAVEAKETWSAVDAGKTTWSAVDAKSTWSAVADDKASTWSTWADASGKKDDKAASTWSVVADGKASTWSAVDADKATGTWSAVAAGSTWSSWADAAGKATGTGAWSNYGDASKTNNYIAQYTGAAGRNAIAGLAGVAGLAAALL